MPRDQDKGGHYPYSYIWRYVKPDQQTLANAIAELAYSKTTS